jgi:Protein kinase domain
MRDARHAELPRAPKLRAAAVSNQDIARERPMIEPTHWIRESHRTIEITRAGDLDVRPDAAFELARAPDGLPLVMHVHRAVDVRRPVLRALDVDAPLSRELDSALTELQRVARSCSVTRRIVRIGHRAYYETVGSTASQFGATLVARMLGAASPLVLPDDVVASREPSRFENSVVLAVDELAGGADDAPSTPVRTAPAPPAPVTFGRDGRLWLGVTPDTPNLAVPTGVDAQARQASGRPLVFETLLALRSARWHVRERDAAPGHTVEGRLSDAGDYRRALARAERLSWSVSRADAAQLVAELARSVDRDWHTRGRVHADLKPGNVLLHHTEIRAFDALDVRSGAIAAGMTEGWAAPEQVLAQPLSFATDVFPLALMAAAALSAVIFGEEHTMIVPAVGRGRRRLRLIKHPDVWLDPQRVQLPPEARLAWRTLLTQCLAFEPARRPQRGAELADRLDDLLRRWELPGRLPVACGPGQLEYLVGTRDPIWILHDGG